MITVNSPRKASKHIVKVLDITYFENHIKEFLTDNGVKTEGVTYEAGFTPLGVVEDKYGNHYLINHEGCGSDLPMDKTPVDIGWYSHTENSFGVMPCATSSLTYDELMEHAVVVKEIPLNEFVRKQNDRLESNFLNWDKFLTDPKQF